MSLIAVVIVFFTLCFDGILVGGYVTFNPMHATTFFFLNRFFLFSETTRYDSLSRRGKHRGEPSRRVCI